VKVRAVGPLVAALLHTHFPSFPEALERPGRAAPAVVEIVRRRGFSKPAAFRRPTHIEQDVADLSLLSAIVCIGSKPIPGCSSPPTSR